jgi:hypothetical protein
MQNHARHKTKTKIQACKYKARFEGKGGYLAFPDLSFEIQSGDHLIQFHTTRTLHE